MSTPTHDVLIIGAGPAGLALAAALNQRGLSVLGLAPKAAETPWPNTYGIWADELEPLGLTGLLSRQWDDVLVYADEREISLNRTYGLFDNLRLQEHLLQQCYHGGMEWARGLAATVSHDPMGSRVATRDGQELSARVVVDASGHQPALMTRPPRREIAFQTAYGIVGTFSRPPVAPGRMVLMDYRAEHLPVAEWTGPPTFLYAMDFGDGEYFVEETSLAHAPPVKLARLERRLRARLAAHDIELVETRHVERCVFPMNLPMPDREHRVLGYGGAASFVHPATGYQVGAALRRAAPVAEALARALGGAGSAPEQVARLGWRAVWPDDAVRRRYLYLFGLANMLRFDARQINSFFASFFALPRRQWTGYLSDDLSTGELLAAMWGLFRRAPGSVRRSLTGSVTTDGDLLWRALRG